MKSILTILAVLTLNSVLSACSSQPYVLKSGEYNRSSANFNKEPEDISTVIVCYSSHGTSVKSVLDLAVDRCAQFGKSAVFKSQNYLHCPLATPVAAHYDCVKPETQNSPIDGYNYQY